MGDVTLLDEKKDVGATNCRQLAALYCGASSGFEVQYKNPGVHSFTYKEVFCSSSILCLLFDSYSTGYCRALLCLLFDSTLLVY